VEGDREGREDVGEEDCEDVGETVGGGGGGGGGGESGDEDDECGYVPLSNDRRLPHPEQYSRPYRPLYPSSDPRRLRRVLQYLYEDGGGPEGPAGGGGGEAVVEEGEEVEGEEEEGGEG